MAALLGPVWRDEAGARLLAASVQEVVAAGREGTGRAEEEMAEDGSAAEEEPEQVGEAGLNWVEMAAGRNDLSSQRVCLLVESKG